MKDSPLESLMSNPSAASPPAQQECLQPLDRMNGRASASSGKMVGTASRSRRERIASIEKEIKAHARRDFELWVTLVLLVLGLGAGLVGALAPTLAGRSTMLHLSFPYLPQLIWGMLGLVALFSIYATSRKRKLDAARSDLVNELVLSDPLESLSLRDPVTQLLNACAIHSVATREVARADWLKSALSFAAIGMKLGPWFDQEADIDAEEQALYYAGRLLKNTFRGSDAIFRNGRREFLVIMPDTGELDAEIAIDRLRANAECWNLAGGTGFEFSFSSGIAPYIPGADCVDIIERARRSMFLNSQKIIASDEASSSC